MVRMRTKTRNAGSRSRICFATFAMLLFALSVGAYASAGETLNVFSRCAKRPRPVLNIAHAGASSLAPQNTLAAGRKAFEFGADLWGVDVRLTQDGVFVLMHDETLERTTNAAELFPSRAPWRVANFSSDEIRTLDAGSWFVRDDPFSEIEAGNVSAEELQAYIGEPVPTLQQALEFTAALDWRIDVEVKPTGAADAATIAERLLALIGQTETDDRVMISSFDHEILRAVKRIDPSVPVGALVLFAPLDPVRALEELEADVYLPSLVGYTSELVARLAELGIGTHPWTYNSIDQLERLATLPGITGIYTDFPQRLEPILDRLFPIHADGPKE
jgi:glycerophosphoryl diester phosphodiesterase